MWLTASMDTCATFTIGDLPRLVVLLEWVSSLDSRNQSGTCLGSHLSDPASQPLTEGSGMGSPASP